MLPRLERTDPRIRRTRRSIEESLETLLRSQGLGTITVQDITAHAEVNRATFYAHYQDKQDLFGQMIRQRLLEIVGSPPDRPLRFEVGELRGLLRALCIFMAEVYDHCHVHDNEMSRIIEQQVQRQLAEWLSESLEKWTPRPNAHVAARQTLSLLTVSSFYAAAAAWGQRQVSGTLEAYLSEVISVMNQGLASYGLGATSTA
jgi:AcrR family transcriptional regulator